MNDTNTRTSSGPLVKSEGREDEDAQRIARGIEETRASMAQTIAKLEHHLSPHEIRETVNAEIKHVEERVRVVVKDQLVEAKTLIREELVEAKDLLKKELSSAYEGAKRNVREATLGKVEDLATTLGDKMNETRETLVDTIRNNPVPAAVMGVGLVWLLMNRSRDAAAARNGTRRSNGGGNGRQDHGIVAEVTSTAASGMHKAADAVSHAVSDAGALAEKVASKTSDAASAIAHKAGDVASNVAHKASDVAGAALHSATDAAEFVAHTATDAASYVGDHARMGARAAQRGFQKTMDTNPIALGAAAMGVGVVVGLALPRTAPENALMGKMRDGVLERAGDMAHDAAQSVTKLAEKSTEVAKKALGAKDESEGSTESTRDRDEGSAEGKRDNKKDRASAPNDEQNAG